MRASYPIGFKRRVVSVDEMRTWRHPTTLLAIGAAVLLLPACGGSGDETQSSTTPGAKAQGAPGAASEAVEMAMGSAPKRSTEAGKQGASDQPAHSSPKADSQSGQTQNHHKKAGSQQQDQEAPKPVHIKGCPVGMSKSQCEQVGLAAQQKQSSSHVVAKDECPAAMSQSECRQAGEVYEESSEGHVVKPSECPRAMTAEQCAEAGKAYEEATR
jgi:hypothetical protein